MESVQKKPIFHGAVMVGPHGARRVLGLALNLRAVLALQAAGATEVTLLGSGASALALELARDDRVRIALVARARWPEGACVVLGDGLVVDTAWVRRLAAAAPGAGLCEGEDVVALRSETSDEVLTAPVTLLGSGAGVALRVTDERSARIATRTLLDSLRKSQDGWVAKALNRHLSLAVTRVLVWTPLRPNQLSVAILGVGLVGAALAARGTRTGLALGGFLLQTQSVLDGCDGELSRLTFRGSVTGEWLDTVGDDITNYSYFGGAALGLHRAGNGRLPLYLGGVGVAVGLVASGLEYRYLAALGSGDLNRYPLGFGNDPEPTAAPSLAGRVLGAIRPAFKRDFFVLAAMAAGFAGRRATLGMLGLFAAGATVTLGAVVASEWRRGGRLPERMG